MSCSVLLSSGAAVSPDFTLFSFLPSVSFKWRGTNKFPFHLICLHTLKEVFVHLWKWLMKETLVQQCSTWKIVYVLDSPGIWYFQWKVHRDYIKATCGKNLLLTSDNQTSPLKLRCPGAWLVQLTGLNLVWSQLCSVSLWNWASCASGPLDIIRYPQPSIWQLNHFKGSFMLSAGYGRSRSCVRCVHFVHIFVRSV